MSKQSNRKTIIGTVKSAKMDKTIVVEIDRKVKHSFYGKYLNRETKLYSHDPNNECEEGDRVEIEQTSPKSKKKRWKLVEIVNNK